VTPHLKKKKKRRRILLVDNDKRTSYIISLILKLNGYDVEYYPDPKSMLSQLQGGVYDLVLLSLVSIETNYYIEIYNQIRNKDRQVKICFMIDDRSHKPYYYYDNFVQSFKGDFKACDFVDKPVNTNEILEIVISHLEYSRK
jgi:DNA-binding NtrC family response regulator